MKSGQQDLDDDTDAVPQFGTLGKVIEVTSMSDEVDQEWSCEGPIMVHDEELQINAAVAPG